MGWCEVLGFGVRGLGVLLAAAVLAAGLGAAPPSASASEGADIGVELAVVDDLADPQVLAVTIRNHGPGEATYPTLHLDAGAQALVGHDADPLPGSRDDGVGCDQPAPGRLGCSWDALAAGSSIRVEVAVEVVDDDRLTASVESAGTPDPNPTANNDDGLLLHPAVADLRAVADPPVLDPDHDEARPVRIPVVLTHGGGRPSAGTLTVAPTEVVPDLDGCEVVADRWECALQELAPGDSQAVDVASPLPEPGEDPVEVTVTVAPVALPDPEMADNVVVVVVHARDATPADIRRHQGAERIRTAIAVSRATHPEGAPAAVLARADEFADALAGAPLAVRVGGPILLTATEQLPDATAEELQRLLGPGGTVHLLGGAAAISGGVEDAVRALGLRVQRHAGANRYATSARILQSLGSVAEVAFADGDTFPDAVVASAAMAARGGAVLLTAGSRLPEETAAHAAGAEWAIGRSAARAVPGAAELAGTTPAETAVVVAEELFPSPTAVVVATSAAFPDALAGGPLGARLDAPLLLTDPDRLSPVVVGWLEPRTAIGEAHLLGGLGALSATVEQQLTDLLAR